LYHLERDIRMAGYDPTGKAKAKILTASANSIQFTKDDNNNTNTRDPDGDLADPNENITYTLGTLDGVKRITLNGQPVAENIDELSLVYLDETGGVPANINAIRSVQISIVARTARQDPGYTDTSTYTNLQGTTFYTPPANELKFRRGMLRTEIRCRNLGL
jgi:type IV pilus assembly protein PilW